MAGIGDYVHARKVNYLKSGLSLYKDNTPPNPQTIYSTQIQQIKNEAIRQKFKNPIKDKIKIERWLNMFFHPGIKRNIRAGELPQSTIDNIQEAITLYIKKNFNGSVTLHPNNLSVSSSDIFDTDKASLELMDAINHFSSLGATTRRKAEGLFNRMTALKNLRDQLGQKNFKNQQVWNELQNLEKDWDQLEADIKRYAEISKNTGATITTWAISKDENGERLDHKINRLINLLKTGASSKITGEYGELVLKATNYVVNKKGNASIKEILKYLNNSLKNISKSNKGVSGNNISFYASYFLNDSDLYNSKGEKINYERLQGDQFTISATEDKVDVTINIDNNLKDLNLSVKNYDLSQRNNLTLLTGRNLLGLVQDYPNFVNHFLNIVGTHKDENFNSSDIALMHSAMKISAFLKAIAGGVVTKQGRNQMADLFIVNDNSQAQGYYKVYFLSDLLDKVIKDINLITIDNYPDGIWMQNKWVGTVNDRVNSAIRITTMVNVMRTMALHISISKKALE